MGQRRGEELEAVISEDGNTAEDCAPLMKSALRAKVDMWSSCNANKHLAALRPMLWLPFILRDIGGNVKLVIASAHSQFQDSVSVAPVIKASFLQFHLSYELDMHPSFLCD